MPQLFPCLGTCDGQVATQSLAPHQSLKEHNVEHLKQNKNWFSDILVSSAVRKDSKLHQLSTKSDHWFQRRG